MSKDNGGPAFPPMHDPSLHDSGMSLLDYFAGIALPLAATRHTQTYVDNNGYTSEYLPDAAYQQTAKDAYVLAAHMLAERAKASQAEP